MDITTLPTAPHELTQWIDELIRWEQEYYSELRHMVTLSKMGTLASRASLQLIRRSTSLLHVMTTLKMYNGHTNRFITWWDGHQDKMYKLASEYEIFMRNNLL